MPEDEFHRARTSQQRLARREHILKTTRELLNERRVADLSLNEIARHVGLAKSNVLRYFSSREAILLSLTNEEYQRWISDLFSTPTKQVDPIVSVASTLATTAANRPLFCELLACTTATLEHNVTVTEVIDFKLQVAEHIERLLEFIESYLGPIDDKQRRLTVIGVHAGISKIWALANPSPILRKAAAQDPRIDTPPTDIESPLTELLSVFFTGLITDQK